MPHLAFLRAPLLLGALTLIGPLVGPLAAAAQVEPFATGAPIHGIACRSDSTQSYTLYLPSAYNPNRRWPALLVFDPGARGPLGAELFRAAAEARGWLILSSDNTRSDGSAEVNQKAIAAMWNEVNTRFAVDPKRIYAAGFSGGGILAYALGRASADGLAGVISSGARFRPGDEEKPLRFPCFGAAGDTDFNFIEMHKVHRLLSGWGTPERFETFSGPHAWLPEEMARRAVDWHELQAIRQGLRAADPALVESFAAADRKAADELEAAGRKFDASRRLAQLARDLAGLRPAEEIATLAARGEALAATPEARRALAEETEALADEEVSLHRFWKALAELRTSEALPLARRFEVAIGLPEIERRLSRPAVAQSAAGTVARRLKLTYLSQCANMLGPQSLASGRAGEAVLFFEVATHLAPDRMGPRYNLACAQARAGTKRAALDSLEKAVALGFADAEAMAADTDLLSLRDEPRFRALLAQLRAARSTPPPSPAPTAPAPLASPAP